MHPSASNSAKGGFRSCGRWQLQRWLNVLSIVFPACNVLRNTSPLYLTAFLNNRAHQTSFIRS
jgi:hypothetical protein